MDRLALAAAALGLVLIAAPIGRWRLLGAASLAWAALVAYWIAWWARRDRGSLR